ncbi:30S ribosomal protein S4 [Candidatus Woesearchaeota archaeon]|nr:30S ribosomal protein S4 [Candidatus Woesearchaeota archaeon]
MGDSQKLKRKYTRPLKLWHKERITEENELAKEYGLKNKKEIWKANSFLKKYSREAKRLVAYKTAQAQKEKDQLLRKLKSLGLIPTEGDLNSVLSLKLKDILGRRLQTLVYKRNLANSVKQARQFIVHRHITVAGKSINTPSYLVRKAEEAQIAYRQVSPMAKADHPAVLSKKGDKPKKGAESGKK